MIGRAVGYICLSLGKEFLNQELGMTVDNYKIEHLLELLITDWSKGRRSFQVLAAAAVLIGNVYAVILSYTWLQWSLRQLIEAMEELTKRNYHRLVRTTHFEELDYMQKETSNGLIRNQKFCLSNLSKLFHLERSVVM